MMANEKLTINQLVHNARLATSLPYRSSTTNDLLTARAGLLRQRYAVDMPRKTRPYLPLRETKFIQ